MIAQDFLRDGDGKRLLYNYLTTLVSRFFKILPMKESGEASLEIYMESLQAELLGSTSLIPALNYDAAYCSLLSILQFLMDTPESSVRTVRREVFHCISICKKLRAQYGEELEAKP